MNTSVQVTANRKLTPRTHSAAPIIAGEESGQAGEQHEHADLAAEADEHDPAETRAHPAHHALPARLELAARATHNEDRADHRQEQEVGQRYIEQREHGLAVAQGCGAEGDQVVERGGVQEHGG